MKKHDLNKPLKVTAALSLAEMGGSLKENHISGVAAVTGVMNSNHYVFYPGAFTPAIPAFLQRGFISPDHSWYSDDAIAMPTMAQEVGSQLAVEAEFHSTDDAQEMRVKCQERMDRGLFVGFSVGVQADSGDWGWFEKGQTLLEHAAGYGCDMSLFDPSIAEEEDLFGVFKVTNWVEWAITLNPAEKRAGATAVASLGVTFEEDLESALAAVRGIISRASEIHDLRAKDGRTLSPARVVALDELRSDIVALCERIQDAPVNAGDRSAAYRYLELAQRTMKVANQSC